MLKLKHGGSWVSRGAVCGWGVALAVGWEHSEVPAAAPPHQSFLELWLVILCDSGGGWEGHSLLKESLLSWALMGTGWGGVVDITSIESQAQESAGLSVCTGTNYLCCCSPQTCLVLF